jgi:hypothetical protein
MIEKSWKISGEDTLGVPKSEDPQSPYFGLVPTTPMMNAQLDQIFTQCVLRPLKTKLLSDLDLKIRTGNPQDFFEIYLTIFILLCNCESIATAQISFARKFGLEVN